MKKIFIPILAALAVSACSSDNTPPPVTPSTEYVGDIPEPKPCINQPSGQLCPHIP